MRVDGFPETREAGDTHPDVEMCRAIYLYLYRAHLPETEYDKSNVRDKMRDAGKKLEQILQVYDGDNLPEYQAEKWY